MFKILIAEDEMLVRLGLKNSVQWHRYDMRVVADAANGQIAWEQYQTLKPDIVITDVKMPVMDGLELIRRIREENTQTKIIILSCVEEFDVARKAVALGVSDYILKASMTEDDIGSVLEKVSEQLRGETTSKPALAESSDKGLVKLKTMKDFLFYGLYSEEHFGHAMKSHGALLHPANLVLCLMEVTYFDHLTQRFKDERGELIHFSILNMLEEVCEGHHRGEAIHDKDNRYILIFSFHDVPSHKNILENARRILTHIDKLMMSYLSSQVCFSVSSIGQGYAVLKKLYQESLFIMKGKYFERTQLIYMQRESIGLENRDVIQQIRRFPEKWSGLGRDYVQELQARAEELAHTVFSSSEEAAQRLTLLLHWPEVLLKLNKEEVDPLVLQYSTELRRARNYEEAVALFGSFLDEVASMKLKWSSAGNDVQKALKYVESHFSRDITLQEVAKHVNLSPSYFSNLFKKEMQLGFVEYVTQQRMERAKALLMDSDEKTYEIAMKVGFPDSNYFSRTFKKYTGRSPVEFRKEHGRHGNAKLDEETEDPV